MARHGKGFNPNISKKYKLPSKGYIPGKLKSLKHYRGKQMNPKSGPMLNHHPYGWWEDAGHWINGAAHEVNKFVGGGDHVKGAKHIKDAAEAGLKIAGKAALTAIGFGKNKTLPKIKMMKAKNKISGPVNKHKYKKGTRMI